MSAEDITESLDDVQALLRQARDAARNRCDNLTGQSKTRLGRRNNMSRRPRLL